VEPAHRSRSIAALEQRHGVGEHGASGILLERYIVGVVAGVRRGRRTCRTESNEREQECAEK
jgi:hypothetical protein